MVVLLLAETVHAGTTKSTPPLGVVAKYPDDLPGPALEVATDSTAVLPAVPPLALPPAEAGLHGAKELRVRGRALDGELRVRGYVTWVYDCADELARANRDASRAEIETAIVKEPGLCNAPMFGVGDRKDTPVDASIWVVDLPRKAPVAVGDHVVVRGRWVIESPRGERNGNGLLVYGGVEPARSDAAAEVALAAGLPEARVETEVPLRPIVDTAIRNRSVELLNLCNKAMVGKQYDAALASCTAATQAWPENHLAWYATGMAQLGRRAWPEAIAALERAAALRPDLAMYQLYAGIARYEAAHGDPEALAAVLRAVTLAPQLWRAHFYLGRMFEDRGEARRAAEQFTAAIALHASYGPAYLALVELYCRWGVLDQAIELATMGTRTAADPGELWFALAQAHAARHADDEAIAALAHVLAAHPDDAGALLQRGQLYLRKHDARGRKDLERVAALPAPSADTARRLARQLLTQLDAGPRPGRRFKRTYRPADEPYKPWNLDDQKGRIF